MTIWIEGVYPFLAGFSEAAVSAAFFEKFLGRSGKPGRVLLFALLSGLALDLPTGLWKPAEFACLLLGYGGLVLKAPLGSALFHLIGTMGMTQLCYGMINSVSAGLFPFLYPLRPAILGPVFMAAGDGLALGLSWLCFRAVFNRFHYRLEEPEAADGLFLPLLLLWAAGGYIGHGLYGNTLPITGASLERVLRHLRLFLVQALGLFSLFSVLSAHQRISGDRARIALSERRIRIQEQYVREAQKRYTGLRALRHDLNNHLLVLQGLLEKNELEEVRAYLTGLRGEAARLSFPFQTGRPAVDVLLENKTASAVRQGIAVTGALTVPPSCPVEDGDLCLLLANALDNALHACAGMGEREERFIRLSGSKQGDFWLLQIENSFRTGSRFRPGTGLSNIRRTAEKYRGTVTINTGGSVFTLRILLLLS